MLKCGSNTSVCYACGSLLKTNIFAKGLNENAFLGDLEEFTLCFFIPNFWCLHDNMQQSMVREREVHLGTSVSVGKLLCTMRRIWGLLCPIIRFLAEKQLNLLFAIQVIYSSLPELLQDQK